MGVMRENQITGSESAHPRADLLHAPHAGIAVLDGEAESAPQRGEIEREILRDFTPVDEHFRSVTDGRDDGPDAHLSWCRRPVRAAAGRRGGAGGGTSGREPRGRPRYFPTRADSTRSPCRRKMRNVRTG